MTEGQGYVIIFLLVVIAVFSIFGYERQGGIEEKLPPVPAETEAMSEEGWDGLDFCTRMYDSLKYWRSQMKEELRALGCPWRSACYPRTSPGVIYHNRQIYGRWCW